MKIIRFIFSLLLAATIFYFLQFRQGSLPPVGQFFNPYAGFWQNAESGPINAPEVLTIEGLKGNVTIKYDKHLIPHVFADHYEDLFVAMGYINAYHRLWQMEMQTYDAAGRLSEVIGEGTLTRDRWQRRKGMLHSAEHTEKEWLANDTIASIMEAYVKGVNAYISQLDDASLPLEYKLLDHKPEPWTTLKCALLLKYMSSMLTFAEKDVENTLVRKMIGEENFNLLFPDFPEGTDPVIPAGTPWKFDLTESAAKPYELSVPDLFDVKVRDPKPDEQNGSNNWVVSGSKTASGHAIFANDMHLPLNLPSIWFQMQLTGPDINVFGHNLPGVPIIVTGFNDSIAWGFTNAYRDLTDWYTIDFKDEHEDEYMYDGKWLKTQKIVEEIKVRGGETLYDTVVYTHYGPVVYDGTFNEIPEKKGLALKWIGHEISYEPIAFQKFMKAKNYADFAEGAAYFSCPPQSIAFASVQGDIAMHVQGKFPIKGAEQGKFVLDGSTSANEWRGFIPSDQNPKMLNPERGYVSSANQHPVDPLYPYYIYNDFYETYRNRSINRALDTMTLITPEQMKILQNDVHNLKAKEFIDLFVQAVDSADLEDRYPAFMEMAKWDGEYVPESKLPTRFELWYQAMYSMLWDELESEDFITRKPSAYSTYLFLKNNSDHPFVDVQSTDSVETVKDVVLQSFDNMLDSIAAWESEMGKEALWGSFKNTRLTHLARLSPFGYEGLNIGGSGSTINAASSTHGPSQRLVVEMTTPPRAWSTYPGGQSGNPGNIHYGHFVNAWVSGDYIEVLFMRSPSEKPGDIIFSQTLNPEKE